MKDFSLALSNTPPDQTYLMRNLCCDKNSALVRRTLEKKLLYEEILKGFSYL